MEAQALNHILGLGTFALQIVTLGLFAALIFRNRISTFDGVIRSVGRHAISVAFAVAFISAALTLYYSEVLGFEPCPLCWWQRIFLYPQVILFAIALWKRDKSVAAYSIVFSALGTMVALYQHALQMLPSGTLPCPAVGVSCAQRLVFELGYITFPLMSATVFAFLLVVMLISRSRLRE
jgi:disulfide bond formation protein DsbB